MYLYCSIMVECRYLQTIATSSAAKTSVPSPLPLLPKQSSLLPIVNLLYARHDTAVNLKKLLLGKISMGYFFFSVVRFNVTLSNIYVLCVCVEFQCICVRIKRRGYFYSFSASI